jgi:hypothetical protein
VSWTVPNLLGISELSVDQVSREQLGSAVGDVHDFRKEVNWGFFLLSNPTLIQGKGAALIDKDPLSPPIGWNEAQSKPVQLQVLTQHILA